MFYAGDIQDNSWTYMFIGPSQGEILVHYEDTQIVRIIDIYAQYTHVVRHSSLHLVLLSHWRGNLWEESIILGHTGASENFTHRKDRDDIE